MDEEYLVAYTLPNVDAEDAEAIAQTLREESIKFKANAKIQKIRQWLGDIVFPMTKYTLFNLALYWWEQIYTSKGHGGFGLAMGMLLYWLLVPPLVYMPICMKGADMNMPMDKYRLFMEDTLYSVILVIIGMLICPVIAILYTSLIGDGVSFIINLTDYGLITVFLCASYVRDWLYASKINRIKQIAEERGIDIEVNQ